MPKTKKDKKYLSGTVIPAVRTAIRSMEPVSKTLLRLASIAVSLTYLAAAALLLTPALQGDFTTALYWSGELLSLGKELLGATFVPVLLFELLLILTGQKKAGH